MRGGFMWWKVIVMILIALIIMAVPFLRWNQLVEANYYSSRLASHGSDALPQAILIKRRYTTVFSWLGLTASGHGLGVVHSIEESVFIPMHEVVVDWGSSNIIQLYPMRGSTDSSPDVVESGVATLIPSAKRIKVDFYISTRDLSTGKITTRPNPSNGDYKINISR